VLRGDTSELIQEIVAEFARVLDELFVDDDLECGASNGGAERVSAEGAAVIARLEDPENFFDETTAETG